MNMSNNFIQLVAGIGGILLISLMLIFRTRMPGISKTMVNPPRFSSMTWFLAIFIGLIVIVFISWVSKISG